MRIREWNESPYKFIKSKDVRDEDGFITDYTWWYDERDGVHFFMFGDNDLYTPNRDYADWECDSYEEAEEWFYYYGTEQFVDDRFDESLKEDISDDDIDRVYKKLSKLNKVDFGKLEDEYLRTRPSVKDAVYKFYGTILNAKSHCKNFVNWVKEEKGIDLKGIPCKKNESLKESKEGRFCLEIWVPGSGGDDERERILLTSNSIDEIINKAYDTDLDYDEAFYLTDTKGVYEPDIDQCYDAEQLEQDIYDLWHI